MGKVEFIVPDNCEECDFCIYKPYKSAEALPFCRLFRIHLAFQTFDNGDISVLKHELCGMPHNAGEGKFKFGQTLK